MAQQMIKKTWLLILLLTGCLLGTSLSQAAVNWTPSTGYTVSGDTSSLFIGDPDEYEITLGMMNRARELQEARKYRAAVKRYRKMAKRYPASIFSPEAVYQVGECEYARGRYRKAFDSYTSLMINYPDFEKYGEVIKRQFSIANDLYEGKRAHYFGFIPGFKAYDRAILMFETMVRNAPYSDYAPMALMKVAELHLKAKDRYYAIDALDRLINNYPESMLIADAYLLLAQTFAELVDGAYYDQGATREAISYFKDFMILFPDHPRIAEAEAGLAAMKSIEAQSKMVKGDFYFYKWKDMRGARVFYNEAITVAPDSPEAEIARAQLAIIDERMEEKADEYRDSTVPSSSAEGVVDPDKANPF